MTPIKEKFRILIVDDHSTMRKIIKKILADAGFNCFFEAEDGLEAVKILDSQPVDLIISDLLMPVMDGLQLLKMAKTRAETAHIPFVMITVEAFQETMNKAVDLKVDSYIVKPFRPNQLIDEIHRVIT